MDIKKVKRKFIINTYLVTFGYETYKGYYREQQRLIKGINKDDVKEFIKTWFDDTRSMVNAKILAIDELKENTEEIEI